MKEGAHVRFWLDSELGAAAKISPKLLQLKTLMSRSNGRSRPKAGPDNDRRRLAKYRNKAAILARAMPQNLRHGFGGQPILSRRLLCGISHGQRYRQFGERRR